MGLQSRCIHCCIQSEAYGLNAENPARLYLSTAFMSPTKPEEIASLVQKRIIELVDDDIV